LMTNFRCIKINNIIK